MANPADIERAKQGKNVWNAWAEAEIAATRKTAVDFSGEQLEGINFSGFEFPGDAWFHDTIFPNYRRSSMAFRTLLYPCLRYSTLRHSHSIVLSHCNALI
jgi:hypothetical protein